MKKYVILSIILVLLLTVGILAGCTSYSGTLIENPDDIIAGVKQMTLTEYKTHYFLGESLDYSKMNVKLLLENGNIKFLNVAENPKTLTVSGYDRFLEGNQILTVKYGGKISAEYQITVLAPEIASISLSKLPIKLVYIEGDRLDMTGAEITVTQTNGNIITFAVTNDIVFSQYFKNDREKQFVSTGIGLELAIRYGSRNIPFLVDVAPRQMVGISVSKNPNKMSYYIGDTVLQTAGMQVTYTYNNGTTEVVPAEAQSELKYKFDFSVESLTSQVVIAYDIDGVTLFSTSIIVQVYAPGFKSIRITQSPQGIDALIEGFSEINYSTGRVEVTFEDDTVRSFSMDDENITHGKFDNTKLGQQNIEIGYRNSIRNTAQLTVTVQPKKVIRVEFMGLPEIQSLLYYEGQRADVSIAKLFYIAYYNNETKTERLEVTQSMLKSGVNLICVSDANTPGKKNLTFVIEGKEASFSLNIIPRAVSVIEIVSEPFNRYTVVGGSPKPAGGSINVLYNNQIAETIPMDSSRVTLEYDTTTLAGNTATVKVFCDKNLSDSVFATYVISVVDLDVLSMTIDRNPTKTSYAYGDQVLLSGLEITLALNGGTQLSLAVLEEKVENSVAYIYFKDKNNASVPPIRLSKFDFCSQKSTAMTATGSFKLDFYGAKASFYALVDGRMLTGIYVYSTKNVLTQVVLGAEYSGINGLTVKMVYSDGTYDIVTVDDANKILNTTQVLNSGWYWYFGSSENTLGESSVYVVYAERTSSQSLSVYSANYSIFRQDAEMRAIEGLYLLKDGTYERVNNLGSQPKGLTPYLGNFYLGIMYTDNELRYIGIAAAMTDYDIKNHSVGTRPVIVWFGGESFHTTIFVDLADLTSVDIGQRPRTVYIFTETLNLDGGTLIRNFNVDVVSGLTRQDSVEMKEARVSFPERAWPTESDFGGAAFLEIPVVLKYEGHEISFAVKVYQKQNLQARVTNTLSYYANVLPPTVVFEKPIADFNFPFPNYVQSYEYSDGTPFESSSNTVNGNIIYDSPKVVGDYYILIRSDGNEYYRPTELRVPLNIEKLSVTVTPGRMEKMFGDADPTLTYTVDSEAWNEVLYLLNENAKLSRAPGEDVGEYAVGDLGGTFAGDVHPYFDISVQSGAGRLNIRPRLFKLDLKSKTLYYRQDENGTAEDLLQDVEYSMDFIEYVDGERFVVTEYVWSKVDYVNHAKYSGYADLLNDAGMYDRKVYTRKLGTNTWHENGKISEQGRYEIKVEFLVKLGVQNLKLENQDNPGTEAVAQVLSLDVKLQPWSSPTVTSGNYIRLEDVTETDMTILEGLVAAAAQSQEFDFVVTKEYVYLWNYRPATWAQNPAGKWLAYQSALTPEQWIGVDVINNRFEGYRIEKRYLLVQNNMATVRLKFLTNNVDRADSQEEPYSIIIF